MLAYLPAPASIGSRRSFSLGQLAGGGECGGPTGADVVFSRECVGRRSDEYTTCYPMKKCRSHQCIPQTGEPMLDSDVEDCPAYVVASAPSNVIFIDDSSGSGCDADGFDCGNSGATHVVDCCQPARPAAALPHSASSSTGLSSFSGASSPPIVSMRVNSIGPSSLAPAATAGLTRTGGNPVAAPSAYTHAHAQPGDGADLIGPFAILTSDQWDSLHSAITVGSGVAAPAAGAAITSSAQSSGGGTHSSAVVSLTSNGIPAAVGATGAAAHKDVGGHGGEGDGGGELEGDSGNSTSSIASLWAAVQSSAKSNAANAALSASVYDSTDDTFNVGQLQHQQLGGSGKNGFGFRFMTATTAATGSGSGGLAPRLPPSIRATSGVPAARTPSLTSPACTSPLRYEASAASSHLRTSRHYFNTTGITHSRPSHSNSTGSHTSHASQQEQHQDPRILTSRYTHHTSYAPGGAASVKGHYGGDSPDESPRGRANSSSAFGAGNHGLGSGSSGVPASGGMPVTGGGGGGGGMVHSGAGSPGHLARHHSSTLQAYYSHAPGGDSPHNSLNAHVSGGNHLHPAPHAASPATALALMQVAQAAAAQQAHAHLVHQQQQAHAHLLQQQQQALQLQQLQQQIAMRQQRSSGSLNSYGRQVSHDSVREEPADDDEDPILNTVGNRTASRTSHGHAAVHHPITHSHSNLRPSHQHSHVHFQDQVDQQQHDSPRAPGSPASSARRHSVMTHHPPPAASYTTYGYRRARSSLAALEAASYPHTDGTGDGDSSSSDDDTEEATRRITAAFRTHTGMVRSSGWGLLGPADSAPSTPTGEGGGRRDPWASASTSGNLTAAVLGHGGASGEAGEAKEGVEGDDGVGGVTRKRSSYHLTNSHAAVELFLRLNHARQTMDFVKRQTQLFAGLDKAVMGVWEALHCLNELREYEAVLMAEPGEAQDVAPLGLLDHAFQTAELCRLHHPDLDWLHLVGLIHGLGKLLAHRKFGSQPQWAICGETYPLGCRFSPHLLGAQYFTANPDRRRRLYNTQTGIYGPGCGLLNVVMSWSAPEYLYLVLLLNQARMPQDAVWVLRHAKFLTLTRPHSCYLPLCSSDDLRRLHLLRSFQNLAAYRRVELPEGFALQGEERTAYYTGLIEKYIGTEKLQW